MRSKKERINIYFVGAGPGDPELITVKGQKIINQADIILYAGSLVPKELFTHARARQVIDSSSLTLEEIEEIILNAHLKNLLLARVHTGDPSLYGTILEQIRWMEARGIAYEIIPGVSAAFAAAAKARVSFTVPELNQTLILTRVEGRTPVPESQRLKKLASTKSALAIYLSASQARSIQEELLQAGFKEDSQVIIGYRVGWPDEQIVHTTLIDLTRQMEKKGFTRQVIFLVLPFKGENKRSKLYDPGFSHGFRS
ncbi:precorrin-4 C(11)-methyltransferase [Desulfohalobiaceae bacterium Ax17]|jgi:precorrin-4/cobalt-precorrin-4 C11-methyltransferase|uniref:precorrin-4 C(11)-methyltransferase n=1 Tax=Desulfovulcanus ferrireducens TaxID=2831190 RepID=UPI00207BC336|nr:precorrin-4 C(11)-methyltransferase [Desulfovulcanus ferrireducens]MBT8762542.1 precorrin-4 C(11)-methyltransferase [Desulfovulcanus ferrireducens]